MMFLEEGPSILATLSQALPLEREPRAAFLDNVFLDGKIQNIAFLRDALAIKDIELGFPERRGNLVLHHLGFGAIAHDGISILDGSDAPHVHTHRRVELQRAATGCRFGISEHDADLFANLVDEDQRCFRLDRKSTRLNSSHSQISYA